MPDILVTGGAGYIGSHVCKELHRSGFTPIVVDNLSTGHSRNVKWGPLHKIDLRDKDRLLKEFANRNFYGVIHLAASAYVYESMQNPIKYFENNLVSTINLLILMDELKVAKFVFSSSCAVYGAGYNLPIKENFKKFPINNYGLSKLMCEEIISHTLQNTNVEYMILRYFNACGANLDGELYEYHEPETHVIPLLVKSAILNSTFSIYGNEFETPDGYAIRDFVHVDDIANAHVEAVKLKNWDQKRTEINLGSGKGTSIWELIEFVQNMGFRFDVETRKRRLGDPSILMSDITTAKDVLNWQPRFSNLETIFSTAMRGYNQLLEDRVR